MKYISNLYKIDNQIIIIIIMMMMMMIITIIWDLYTRLSWSNDWSWAQNYGGPNGQKVLEHDPGSYNLNKPKLC